MTESVCIATRSHSGNVMRQKFGGSPPDIRLVDSSGYPGNTSAVRPFWDALYAARAGVIVNGHDHDYERFGRQAPGGSRTTHGIIEFVVGTGGAERRMYSTIRANSVVRNATTFGVLKLTLHAGSFDWQFVPEDGQAFTDTGAGKACTHRA
jgi:hypothetical protein